VKINPFIKNEYTEYLTTVAGNDLPKDTARIAKWEESYQK